MEAECYALNKIGDAFGRELRNLTRELKNVQHLRLGMRIGILLHTGIMDFWLCFTDDDIKYELHKCLLFLAWNPISHRRMVVTCVPPTC